MEFAFNLSPEVADKTALPQFQLQSHIVGGQPGRYLTVQFLRQLGNTNLTYVVQSSSDLVTWTDVCTAAGTNRPSGSGFVSETGTSYQRQVVARDIIPVEQAAAARFARFKLIWN